MAKIKGWNPEIKRQKILNSAIQILNRKEYYQCPIDEIAKNAGVAKGTVYLYFKNKEDIYFSVLINLIDKVIDIAENVQKNDLPAKKQLFLLLQRISNFIDTYRHLFLSIRQEVKPPKEKLHDAFHRKIGELIKAISAIIESGVKKKELKSYPGIVLATIFLSLTSVIAHQKIEVGKHKIQQIDISPELLFKIFMEGIER
ncbi:MAG: TetR/AcrR family transcriptional regulator [Elusimicrobia bacterium]|nr:TetR/AcrR family transcriptional regulator [Elusimicrobiota bacterium]